MFVFLLVKVEVWKPYMNVNRQHLDFISNTFDYLISEINKVCERIYLSVLHLYMIIYLHVFQVWIGKWYSREYKILIERATIIKYNPWYEPIDINNFNQMIISSRLDVRCYDDNEKDSTSGGLALFIAEIWIKLV